MLSRLLCGLWFISVFFGLTPLSSAKESSQDSPQIYVQQADPDFDVEELKRENVKIQPISKRDRFQVPEAGQRNRWLAEADLTFEVRSWDAAQKDVLVMRASRYPLEKLSEQYPNLEPAKLRKLKAAIRGK